VGDWSFSFVHNLTGFLGVWLVILRRRLINYFENMTRLNGNVSQKMIRCPNLSGKRTRWNLQTFGLILPLFCFAEICTGERRE
jgi:hypothetical protein